MCAKQVFEKVFIKVKTQNTYELNSQSPAESQLWAQGKEVPELPPSYMV